MINDIKLYTQELSLLYAEQNEIIRDSSLHMLKKLFEEVVVVKTPQDAYLEYKNHFELTNKYYDIILIDSIEVNDKIKTHKENQVIAISVLNADNACLLVVLINALFHLFQIFHWLVQY